MPQSSVTAQHLKEGAINPEDVEKAFVALQKFVGHSTAQRSSLLGDDDEFVQMQISLRKVPNQARHDKPIRLPLPHSLWEAEEPDVCLFVKDIAGEGHKAAKERLAQEAKAGVKKVIGLSKLKSNYESYEAKRALCNEFDIFLADARVLPSLARLIGKSFFKKKKQPIAIDLEAKDWAGQIKKALRSTYMFKTGGSCITIRVARTSFEAKDAVQNIMTVVKSAVARIPKQWSNVQAVYLKTADSAALPILQQLPDDGVGKIAGGISANDDETILPRDKVKSTKPRAAKSAGTPKKLKGK